MKIWLKCWFWFYFSRIRISQERKPQSQIGRETCTIDVTNNFNNIPSIETTTRRQFYKINFVLKKINSALTSDLLLWLRFLVKNLRQILYFEDCISVIGLSPG